MNLDELMLKRRSVRKYTDKEIPSELVDKLLHYAMSGPSACNRCPWEFYVVTNKEVLNQIETSGKYTKHHSPLKIIVCGNMDKGLPKELGEYWIQDCSSAIENILLGVTDMGLGACWEGAYPQKRVVESLKTILNLPQNHIPLGIISIGYPDEEPTPRDQYDPNLIHYVK